MKATTGFRKSLTFLIFVAISALFWFILALNDNMQDDFEVKVNIYNVPDSVTFINIPPQKIHVVVRDNGTNLWRNGVFGNAQLNINFKDFSNDGRFRMSKAEVDAALKNVFGQTANLLSSSIDSLSLSYTNLPGRRVPVEIVADMTPAVGKIITSQPNVEPKTVVVYSTRQILDTLTKVRTEPVVKRHIEESKEYDVRLHPIAGVRIEPSSVVMTVGVEPLVKKKARVNVSLLNVPEGTDLLLFPSNARVEYYMPMSLFNQNSQEQIEIYADYHDLVNHPAKLPLYIGHHERNLINLTLLSDSVEYTVVRN